MPVVYKKEEILQKVERAAENMASFYRQDFVNYRGKTRDTKEHYTEVVAQWCCQHIDLFDRISQITRETTYKTETVTHRGNFNPDSPRVEEITAMKMFRYCKDGGHYDFIGKIIDYQTPLKNKQKDDAGKIDLLAYDGKCLRLLELKKPGPKETMLRCVLEGFTYLKTVDKEKLLLNFGLPADTAVQACPFTFHGAFQWSEMQEDRPWLKKLMTALNSTPYYIHENNGIYIVTEE